MQDGAPAAAPPNAATPPDAAALMALLQATWPAAARRALGPFVLQDGAGGGKRVSAAHLSAHDFTDADLDRAEAAMRHAGMRPLFCLPQPAGPKADAAFAAAPLSAAERLDSVLQSRGYALADPTLLMVAPLALPRRAPDHPVYALWPPLAIQNDLWEEDGVTAARRAVMARCTGARAALLGRLGDRPAGVGFVALGGVPNLAMLHALAVRPDLRRAGMGQAMVLRAMDWAQAEGAQWLGLAVTEANAPARALYQRLGFSVAAQYHYRELP